MTRRGWRAKVLDRRRSNVRTLEGCRAAGYTVGVRVLCGYRVLTTALLLCFLAPLLFACAGASTPTPASASEPSASPASEPTATAASLSRVATPSVAPSPMALSTVAPTATPVPRPATSQPGSTNAVASPTAAPTATPGAADTPTAVAASPIPAESAGPPAPPGAREDLEDLVIYGTEGAGLWLRRAPGGEQIDVYREGTRLQPLGSSIEAQDRVWYNVRMPDGVEGWLAAQYTIAASAAPPPSVARPVRLRIPVIGVDAVVESVGLTPDGAMGVPSGPYTVGWYNLGPLPGAPGNAVIDGHVDYRTVGPAVFWRLRELRPGDALIVTSVDGREQRFVVTDLVSYSAANFPIGRVFGPADSPRLNLITCSGTFDARAREYDRRLVVYAEGVGPAAAAPSRP